MKRPAARAADVFKADPPPTHNARRCCCDRCDPTGAKTAKARARWAADRAAAAALAADLKLQPRPAVLAKSAPRYRPPTDETRRMAELLREGHSSARAIEIIESEKAQRKDPTS